MLKITAWYSSTRYESTECADFYAGHFTILFLSETEYMVNTEHIKPPVQSYFKTVIQKEVILSV